MGKRNVTTLPNLRADVARLVEDFEKETDRGVALLGAAFLDDVLDVMLRAHFIEDGDVVNKLISPGRPLESFGARTHLAYCLGLLGKDIYHDMNMIREIRNDFAHRQPTTFEQAEIGGKCQGLQAIKVMMPDDGCSCRERFIVSVVLIANHLVIMIESMRHAVPAKSFWENGVLRLK
ncbi:MAG: MltR family transcriptional regulator [Planctomycetota bacterium]|nr:MltR family transcriptional regulator [Planctomycetota bacterium]